MIIDTENMQRTLDDQSAGIPARDAEIVALRQALEVCRFALEPYDDIKPRDWTTDREKLRRAHKAASAALTQQEQV